MEISDQTTCLDPYFASFEEKPFIEELQAGYARELSLPSSSFWSLARSRGRRIMSTLRDIGAAFAIVFGALLVTFVLDELTGSRHSFDHYFAIAWFLGMGYLFGLQRGRKAIAAPVTGAP